MKTIENLSPGKKGDDAPQPEDRVQKKPGDWVRETVRDKDGNVQSIVEQEFHG